MGDPEAGGSPGGGRSLSFTSAYRIQRHQPKKYTLAQTLLLGYQSLGVVYGDLGTSPLYVFPSITMTGAGERDILGILSLIFWTLTTMGLVKYVLIVLHADDHGEGGTFALYSLLRQHLNFKGKAIVQSTKLESDEQLTFHSESRPHSRTKRFLEGSERSQTILTLIVLVGTCMVIGDGALTPAISVLSAVQGIQTRSPKIKQEHVVLISVVILVILFLLQRFGTSKVSATFSPIMVLWFLCNSSVGLYNIVRFHPTVFKGLSPHYIYYFFAGNGKKGWELLGAVVLCITGAEAMFADLGHFSKGGIQFAFSTIVYPALVLTYAGQAAYLVKHPEAMSTAFYSATPNAVFWPMFVVSTLAAIVASQSLISASFSIIRQSMALGCFPRVTIVHTSARYEGQIYSPEINYLLMFICILLTVVFKGGVEIGNAFGVAVIWVMLITTGLMVVVMLVVWNTNVVFVGAFALVFFVIEGTYMTSLLNKLSQGGWVPFAISAVFMVIMLSWTYGRSKKSDYEAERKTTLADFDRLLKEATVHRVPGLCFFCTDLINGIPPIVCHYIRQAGSLREVTVMVTVRILPIKSVLPEERLLAARMGPKGMYRCLVQYGYMDVPDLEGADFVATVIEALKEKADTQEEVLMLESELRNGVVYVLGRNILKRTKSKGKFSSFVIDTLYRFLQKNSRSTISALKIPPAKVLQVGMVYEV